MLHSPAGSAEPDSNASSTPPYNSRRPSRTIPGYVRANAANESVRWIARKLLSDPNETALHMAFDRIWDDVGNTRDLSAPAASVVRVFMMDDVVSGMQTLLVFKDAAAADHVLRTDKATLLKTCGLHAYTEVNHGNFADRLASAQHAPPYLARSAVRDWEDVVYHSHASAASVCSDRKYNWRESAVVIFVIDRAIVVSQSLAVGGVHLAAVSCRKLKLNCCDRISGYPLSDWEDRANELFRWAEGDLPICRLQAQVDAQEMAFVRREILSCKTCGYRPCKLSDRACRRCSRCHGPAYCCRECQRRDWPQHRTACVSPIASRSITDDDVVVDDVVVDDDDSNDSGNTSRTSLVNQPEF